MYKIISIISLILSINLNVYLYTQLYNKRDFNYYKTVCKEFVSNITDFNYFDECCSDIKITTANIMSKFSYKLVKAEYLKIANDKEMSNESKLKKLKYLNRKTKRKFLSKITRYSKIYDTTTKSYRPFSQFIKDMHIFVYSNDRETASEYLRKYSGTRRPPVKL